VLRRAEAMVGNAAAKSDSDGLVCVDACFADIEAMDGTQSHRIQLERLSRPEWWAYEERKARAPLKPAPCMHIAAARSAETIAQTMTEHHAVLDIENHEVIHYAEESFRALSSGSSSSAAATPETRRPPNGDGTYKIWVEPFEEFWRAFPSWRVVQLPTSHEHALEILMRARSKVEHGSYMTSTTAKESNEHFAMWCFTGDESNSTRVSTTTASTAVGSAVSCGMSYSLAGGVTYSVATPYYALGLIPWGTTTTSVGLSGYAVAGIASLGLGVGLAASAAAAVGLSVMARQSNELLAVRVPICVGNKAEDEEVMVTIKNLDSMFNPVLGGYSTPKLDDVAHWTRAKRGVGSTDQMIPPLSLVDVSPPAYEECYERFELCFQVRRCRPIQAVEAAHEPVVIPASLASSSTVPSYADATEDDPVLFRGSSTGSASVLGDRGGTVEVGGGWTQLRDETDSAETSAGWRDYLPSMPSLLASRDSAGDSTSAPPVSSEATNSAVRVPDKELWREVCRREVRRGDVLIFLGGSEVIEVS